MNFTLVLGILIASVGLLVISIAQAFNRILFRFILCGLLARRDIIPVRVGLRLVVIIEDESLLLLANNTLLHDPLFDDMLSVRPGLDDGDLGGLRITIISLVVV
jgi:hypothetical protein